MDWNFENKDAPVHKGTNTIGGILEDFPIGCKVVIREDASNRAYINGKLAKVVGHAPTGAIACYNPDFYDGHTAAPYFKFHPENYNECYRGKLHWVSATVVDKI